MLIFSAITPHPPILIPTIGRENLKIIEKTKQAIEKLAEDLYSLKPETIIIFSPHGQIKPHKIVINQSPTLKGEFNQFGDLVTKLKWPGDLGLSYKIYEYFETKMPISLIHHEELDHGSSVPLYYLTQNLNETKIIPLYHSLQDAKIHFKFGQELAEIIQQSDKRIAVIASGDLSHRLTPNAPAGYSVQGKKFDKKIIDLLKNVKYREVANMDPALVEKAGECGFKSIVILLGVLNNMNLAPQILSYEGPFGVGYLVAEFI